MTQTLLSKITGTRNDVPKVGGGLSHDV